MRRFVSYSVFQWQLWLKFVSYSLFPKIAPTGSWRRSDVGGCEISRTVDRINQIEKSYQVNFVTLPSYSRFCIFLYSLNLYEVCLVLSNAKFSFGPGGHFCTVALKFLNCINTYKHDFLNAKSLSFHVTVKKKSAQARCSNLCSLARYSPKFGRDAALCRNPSKFCMYAPLLLIF